MRQTMTNESRLPVVVNRRDDPEPVAAHLESGVLRRHVVHAGERLLQVVIALRKASLRQ
jgi:hypothetical protein